MKLYRAILLLQSFRLCSAEEAVVFVGGLASWGEDEMFGIPYWGFNNPLAGLMPGKQLNYPEALPVDLPTFVAPVGPFSSMHDRACELYAMIQGEQTDFGYWHAQQFGHDRYGRNFTKGYFQQGKLGEIGSDGRMNRVHLICHSFGGNTARYLERLLHEGLSRERNYPKNEMAVSSLFLRGERTGAGQIGSLVTVATPFDGSTLHTRLGGQLATALESILLTFITLFARLGLDNLVYNADLDHFGLERSKGERLNEYLSRVFSSKIFQTNFTDSAEYDLSPRAQYEFNQAGPRAYQGTHYLAFSTHQTRDVEDASRRCRRDAEGDQMDAAFNFDMELVMRPTGAIIGDLTDARLVNGECVDEVYKACNPDIPVRGPWNDKGFDGWCADNSWESNDGLVPRRSSTGPTFGYPWDDSRPHALGILDADSSCPRWEPFPDGQWRFIDVGVDHAQVIGFRTQLFLEDVNQIYMSDIPSLLNRIKYTATSYDDSSFCCTARWCQRSTYDPPSPYPCESTEETSYSLPHVVVESEL